MHCMCMGMAVLNLLTWCQSPTLRVGHQVCALTGHLASSVVLSTAAPPCTRGHTPHMDSFLYYRVPTLLFPKHRSWVVCSEVGNGRVFGMVLRWNCFSPASLSFNRPAKPQPYAAVTCRALGAVSGADVWGNALKCGPIPLLGLE